MERALVTGGTSGIGLAIAQALVGAGFAVTVTGRDAEKGASLPAGLAFLQVDHSDLGAVRQLADTVGPVDVLVNNVGGAFWNRSTTVDGHERTLALNLLAPVVLTERLLPDLAPGSRIVNIVTKLERKMAFALDDPQGERRYRGFDAYAGAKVALLGWTLDLAERADAIAVNGVHPGIVMGTGFGADMPWMMRALGPVIAGLFRMTRPMEDAVRTPLRLATTDRGTGRYLDLDAELPLPTQLEDPAARAHIATLCAELGEPPDSRRASA
ncbi:MAG: SDR family NAD(P)-dependent oxidoreductase [Alphaproteobacteria bacterium]|nr:SDR family NAD(P)-dependent oxidoreductase [Alphaproteobacteria bacterium]MCB9694035.1 SDR family NAD(P)-dependent oxidoreductase [Alphaproteobacteria bacterium]